MNTIIDHHFAGNPRVEERDPEIYRRPMIAIRDGDPDGATFLFVFRDLQALDALIHGLESVRQDIELREAEAEKGFVGIGAATMTAERRSTVGG